MRPRKPPEEEEAERPKWPLPGHLRGAALLAGAPRVPWIASSYGPTCSTLTPRPTIGKECGSATPTRPTTGMLTPRKVTLRRKVVIDTGSDDDDNTPLTRHDARVDLNPSGARIHYTQELAFVMESPPRFIVTGRRVGTWYG